ncbi:MAG: hypothetical protein F6K28_46880 [Microcoleus sp. SIO2G3]|nr:hypothetical protein [Microcoleus sp. SIO2G3]
MNTSGTSFIGANALRVTNNTGIPLTSNRSHSANGYSIAASGIPSMAPFGQRGQRYLPTVLDLAILDDIGYQVDYSAAPVNSFPSLRQTRTYQQNNLTFAYARCACASCLVSS